MAIGCGRGAAKGRLEPHIETKTWDPTSHLPGTVSQEEHQVMVSEQEQQPEHSGGAKLGFHPDVTGGRALFKWRTGPTTPTSDTPGQPPPHSCTGRQQHGERLYLWGVALQMGLHCHILHIHAHLGMPMVSMEYFRKVGSETWGST